MRKTSVYRLTSWVKKKTHSSRSRMSLNFVVGYPDHYRVSSLTTATCKYSIKELEQRYKIVFK